MLKKLLLPFVEQRRVYALFVTDFGDWSVLQKVQTQDFHLFRTAISASFSVAHAPFPGYGKVAYSSTLFRTFRLKRHSMEHLILLVGKESVADALLRHFAPSRRCLVPRFRNCASFFHGAEPRLPW